MNKKLTKNAEHAQSVHCPSSRFSQTKYEGKVRQIRYDAFRKELPFFYGILVANSCGLVYTHIRYTAAWLGIYVPLALGGVCIFRIIYWIRRTGAGFSALSTGNAVKVRLGFGFSLAMGYVGWGLLIYPYGDVFARCHVAISVFMAVLGCIFCLAYMRAALAIVGLVSIIPFIPLVLLSLRNREYGLTVIAIDLAMLACAMALVMRGYSGRLIDLMRSQHDLLKKQEEAEFLHEENFRLANIDALTLLPGRPRFLAELNALLLTNSTTQSGFAVGMLKIDGLNPINYLFGHEFRDSVVKEVGLRLSLLANPDFIIARTGDRTFGLLVRSNVTALQLQDMGALICTRLEQPYELSSKVARLSVSVGFALYPEAGITAEHLYATAEIARQHAKSARQGHTVVFARNHRDAIKRDSEIEHHLRKANLEQELSVFFQPIFDVASKGIVAFEALARWKSPVLGSIPPADFLAIAERSHLIHTLTNVLLRKTLDAAAVWPPQIRVSFNLSARDLSSTDAISSIVDTVLASGVTPRRVNFEVTETALISDIDRAGEALLALKRMGAQIYLDDFGTGYSNLSYIHRLPIDVVKIDRSFITDVVDQRTARIVVQTIVDLCARLSLECIAEGVETASQVNALLSVGCGVMQGYFFGRPVPSSDVLDLFLSNGFMKEYSGPRS